MNNSALYATQIAQKTLGYFKSNMGMASTVSRDFDYVPAAAGETVKIGKRGSLVANSKVAGANVTLQTPSTTGVDVTLNNHYEVTFDLEDVVREKSDERRLRTIEGYAEDAAAVLLETVEATLAAVYASIAASAITFDKSSSAAKIASLLQLRKEFFDAKVPSAEQKHLYLGSSSAIEILSDERLASSGFVGSEAEKANVEGFLTKRFGFNMLENQQVIQTTTTGTTPVTTEHNIAYTKNAVCLAVRPMALPSNGLGVNSSYVADAETGIGLRVIHSYNPDKLAEQVTLDVLFGSAIVDQRRVRAFNLTV